MKSPELRRTFTSCALLGMLVAGCAHDDNDADHVARPTRPASSVADAPSGPRPPSPPAAATDNSAVPAAAVDGESDRDVDVASSPTVAVGGGELPSSIIDGYAANGGDLITPQEWRSRFGDSTLPQLIGPGVTLVEALYRTELTDDGWVRVDEANWLAMDHADRDAKMAELAAAAEVESAPTRAASAKEAADCVIDTYPVSSTDATWQIQGCSYERFPRLLTLGVSRAGHTDAAPSTLDPTVAGIVGALDGEVIFAEVRFGSPGEDGSTLHLSAQVRTGIGLAAATDAVTAGPLAGWQTFPGDESMLLSGPTGATWTLSERVAVFTWAGRW